MLQPFARTIIDNKIKDVQKIRNRARNALAVFRANPCGATKRGNHMKLLASAAVLAVLASASPALAQSSGLQTSGTASAGANQNVAAAQKIKQDLTNAGFTDVKVVAQSFVVQAKSKDGDPVVMTIGPHGMSVFEAMNINGSNSHTTGSAFSPPGNGSNAASANHSASPSTAGK
jgi:hypothetical protein